MIGLNAFFVGCVINEGGGGGVKYYFCLGVGVVCDTILFMLEDGGMKQNRMALITLSNSLCSHFEYLL